MNARLALAVFFLAPAAHAQWGRAHVVQPRTFGSPDGHWTLAVDPTQRDGTGPGRYLCKHDGKDAWSGEKPWTLADVVVTDEGFAGGYGYLEGSEDAHGGEFYAVILAPDGSAKLEEKHERESSHFMHEPANPRGLGVFQQVELKRMVFRIADPDMNRQHEEWWSFQLPDAKEISRKRPGDLLPEKDVSDLIVAVQAVPGTPLTLVEWRMFAYPKIGLQFTLHDVGLEPLWDMAKPEELTGPDDREMDSLFRSVYEKGTLLAEKEAGHFTVGLPRSGEKIRYVVEKIDGAWKVRELGREKWSIEGDAPPAGPSFEELPIAKLPLRGTFDIAGGTTEHPAVRDIWAFDCATEKVLRLVRREADGSFTLIRTDETGRASLEKRIEIKDVVPDIVPSFWSLGPDHWLATQSPYGEGAQALAWRIDETSGLVMRLAAFECLSIDDVAPLGQDRFVVIATERGKYTMTSSVRGFDAEGHTSWKHEENFDRDEPSSLLSPEAIAVTTDGSVVVLDVIRHTLQTFGADGTFTKLLELDKAWGKKAEYPSGLKPDIEGGVLVQDFAGNPPLYRMRSDGTVRERLSPHFKDGKVVDGLTRNARVAPDGKLWASDGQRLLRLDEKGVVDLQVGAQADANVLGEPSGAAIDVFGRVLVQDGATGAVHVFDGQGKKLFVCRPEPTDFKDPSSIAHLAATRERGVIAEIDGSSYVRFGPAGARQDRIEFERSGRSLVFSPASDMAYGSSFNSGFAQFGADLKPRVNFDRAPDGTWLIGADDPAVAIDGAVAALAGGGPSTSGSGLALALYETADPKSCRWIGLPTMTPHYELALGRSWAVCSGYGPDVLLVHRSDGRFLRVSVQGAEKKTNWHFGFDPANNELIALEGGAKLHRFTLP